MSGVVFLIAYLVGAVPSGYWFAKYFFDIDVTKVGSKNIGATNVSRVLGSKKYFFLILFFDFSKSFTFLFVVNRFGLSSLSLFLCACALLVGNAYSIFLKFHGGKGVATLLGILAYLFPYLCISFIVVWGIILFLCKRVDVASLVATSSLPIMYLLISTPNRLTILFLLFTVMWIVLRHKDNLLEVM